MTSRDLVRYLVAYPHEMVFSDDDPAAILDRYHSADVEYYNDGLRLDRNMLAAHARPARKNVSKVRVTVHVAIVASESVAARYTLEATMRSGDVVATDIYMFGQLAADGRIRRIDQITRTPSTTPSADGALAATP